LRRMIRTALEKMARGWAFPRRLPPTVGGSRIWISPDARLRLLQPGAGGFDKGLLDWASCLVHRGHKVWDIGANVGVFAFAAAGRAGAAGRVLAVEPDPWLFGLLQRSRAANRGGLAPVELLCAAVADRSGVARFTIAGRGRASNYLADVPLAEVGEREQFLVPTVTADALVETAFPPDLVKIDVERAELLVLRGAGRLLAEVRPALLLEVAESNAEAVRELLGAARYRLFDAAEPARGFPPVARPVWDTLALPEERAAAWLARSG
jgi:FkbM family methyltransferase